MKVRYPVMDYSEVRPHWAEHIEFAQAHNASSTIPSHVEPYLVKVLRLAKKEIDPSKTKLHEDIDIFIKQEMQHCKQHIAFNKMLYEAGYDRLPEMEQGLADDLNGFLTERSLKFNLAYSEGFEAMGSIAAPVFFEHYGEFVAGADPKAVKIWQWHLAEEFEHRSVCHDVYHELYGGKSLWDRWIYRVQTFIFAVKHLKGFGDSVREYLLETDRARMSTEEREASIEREKQYKKLMGKLWLPQVVKVFSPFYDPGKKKTPRGLDAFLAQIEAEEAAAASA